MPSSSCVALSNYENVQYTIDINVGTNGQTIPVVPDTGSFDLVLDSTECNSADCHSHVQYNPNDSSDYVDHSSAGTVTITYGQGGIQAMEATDKVTVGGDSTTAGQMLLMTSETLAGWGSSVYSGIMGMGKQSTTSEGGDALLTSLNVDEFSICLGQNNGAQGRLDLHGKLSGSGMGSYTMLDSVGDIHWGIKLSSMQAGNENFDFCTSGSTCAALIDSGTSLMTFPTSYLVEIFSEIGDVALDNLEMQSSCSGSDFNSLPTLKFKLDGQEFELKKEFYMAEIDLADSSETLGPFRLRPHMKAQLREYGSKAEGKVPARFAQQGQQTHQNKACLPMFSDMDTESTQYGPLVIFGQPFFRAYSAAFDRSGNNKKIGFAKMTSASRCSGCGGNEDDEQQKKTQEAALQPAQQSELENQPVARIPAKNMLLPWYAADPSWSRSMRNETKLAVRQEINTNRSSWHKILL